MFKDAEYKFKDAEYKFKDVEHKFTVREHKNYFEKKTFIVRKNNLFWTV